MRHEKLCSQFFRPICAQREIRLRVAGPCLCPYNCPYPTPTALRRAGCWLRALAHRRLTPQWRMGARPCVCVCVCVCVRVASAFVSLCVRPLVRVRVQMRISTASACMRTRTERAEKRFTYGRLQWLLPSPSTGPAALLPLFLVRPCSPSPHVRWLWGRPLTASNRAF